VHVVSGWDDPPRRVDEPDVDPVDPEEPTGETIEVPRASVEQLDRSTRWLIALVVAMGLLGAWDSYKDRQVDEHQAATDARLDQAVADLEDQAERLDEVVQQRADDAARAAATECVRAHVRFDLLQRILDDLGASDETRAILPPPACDLGEAQAELTGS
jgi:hypothetical protein